MVLEYIDAAPPCIAGHTAARGRAHNEDMPRKITSQGEAKQQRKTSQKRAMDAIGPSGRNTRAGQVLDGGKWAGSGRKTVEHSKGPAIARQRQTGRGAKSRPAERVMKANHPSHG